MHGMFEGEQVRTTDTLDNDAKYPWSLKRDTCENPEI